jgi:hypothetical protein
LRSKQAFFLTNTHVEDSISPDFDIIVPGGQLGDLPLAGDWEGNGTDDVGVFRPSDRTMRLTVDFGVTTALLFELQAPGDSPVGGNWDGN